MSLTNKTGTIQYTQRAFHQDASESMKGDIVRGLIELITNSDDAYASTANGSNQKKIIIEVEHRRGQPWLVVVKDRATGMSPQIMLDRITRLGGRTSGFEIGENRRGNLGRGAKDLAAFGTVTFKSVHEGIYGELILHSDGRWKIEADRKVTQEDKNNLGIPRGNGTVVEIQVSSNIRCPQHAKLKQKLETHFQLRDILSDPNRRVELVNRNDGTKDLLTYEYPKLPLVFNGDLSIDGYPDSRVHIKIYRNLECYEYPIYDPGRPNGILIKGSRAIYENTLFDFDGKLHSGWLSGELVSPFIDQLAREYDDHLEKGIQPADNNPLPIISRHRGGLNPDHPFYQALKKSAENPLRELIAQEEERVKQTRNDIEDFQTKSDLDKLAREVGRLINEELRDIEAEELPQNIESGEAPIFSIIPSAVYAYLGEDRTFTVAVRVDHASIDSKVSVIVDPEGVVELLTQTVSLRPHTRRNDLLVGQIRVRPIIEGESTLITASLNGLSDDAIVEVISRQSLVEEEVEPPDTLIFERPSYRIGWKKSKNLILIAPANVVAEYGENIRVKSSHKGIVVRTPSVNLIYDESLDYYKGAVKVEARTLDATSVITADAKDLTATTHVKVTMKERGSSVKIKLVPQLFGSWRAVYEKENLPTGEEILVIRIAGEHPAIKPFLDVGQNNPVVREIFAEVVADAASRIVVQELYQIRRSTEEIDASRIYFEHNRRVQRFLPIFQRILIGKPENILSHALEPISVIETEPN